MRVIAAKDVFMRRTKIVCTIGPACDSPAMIEKLVLHGMNVARLNMSHGDREQHRRNAENVRKAAAKHGKLVAIMVDVRGPKIRTGTFPGGAMKLVENSRIILSSNVNEKGNGIIPIEYPLFHKHIKAGDKVYIADGAIELVAKSVSGNRVLCETIVGGVLGDRKGVTVPGAEFDLPSITRKDEEDVRLAASIKADFLAQSFVRRKEDVVQMKALLKKAGCDAHVVAKIEDAQGLRCIDGIIEEADAIMVARGDLGVQIPFEDVPVVQKAVVAKCRRESKPVIIATQMLESMINYPQPTRAEVTDVANAILDGTDAVMLSGETASGKFPLRCLEAMDKIVRKTEATLLLYDQVQSNGEKLSSAKAIGKSVVYTARDMRARAIIAYTSHGHTARYISSHRPFTPIIAATASKSELCKLQLLWGVQPELIALPKSTEDVVAKSIAAAKKNNLVGSGDVVVITAGVPLNVPGNTNLMQIKTV